MVVWALQVELKKNRLLKYGVTLIFLGLLAPAIIKVEDLGIVDLMIKSLLNNSGGILLMASLKLVLLNTMRALPHYVGALLITEGLGFWVNKKIPYMLVAPPIIIAAVYVAINFIYGITYDFGVPAISLVLTIVLFSKMSNMARNIWHKTLLFAILLFGVEWLDIVPILTNYWFGHGEISMDLKRIANFIGQSTI